MGLLEEYEKEQLKKSVTPFNIGDTVDVHVRIVEGVMAGYEAVFQARTGKERVLLLLQLAQDRTARIQVNANDIEPVNANWSWTDQNRDG